MEWELEPLLLAAHPEFYEKPDRIPISYEHLEVVRRLVPPSWEVIRSEVWIFATPPNYPVRLQGWKIHLSSALGRSLEVLERACRVCVELNLAFKCVSDPGLLTRMNSKGYPRPAACKFIVVYPNSDEQFKHVCEVLYEEFKGFEGPYVLSDRRYKDSKVVHYCYGAFLGKAELSLDGRAAQQLVDPHGSIVPDLRVPYWHCPAWVTDPFDPGEEDEGPTETLTLGQGRFVVEGALSFSTSGGVYRATDSTTGGAVVIKEARPYTSENVGDGLDAVGRLRKEWRLLAKLAPTELVPAPVALFEEGEHLFLAEEFVEGMDLVTFVMGHNPVISRINPGPDDRRRYLEEIGKVWYHLALAMLEFKRHNVLHCDFSVRNVVLTDPKRGTVKLIDLESSVECGVDAFNRFSTPGFASQRHFQEGARDWADDAYSLGAIFLHNLLPGNLMFQLEPAAAGRFLDRAAAYFGLPKQVHGAGAIAGLLSPDPAERPTVEEVVRVLEDGVVPLEPQDLDTLPPEDVLESVVDRAVEYILSSADSSRDTRLFPGDIASRQSNPLSVAYGVAGVVHALKTIGKPVPGWVLAWVLDKGYRHLNAERMTPGLYLGLCGVSWVLREQGLEDLADRLLRLASRHPLLFEESSLFYGTSGYGLACLAAYERTRQQRWLDEADRAGREIRQRAVENRETLWTSQQLQKYTGYARGGSGVALFLLYLAHATQDAAYLELGKEALEWDLRHVMPYPEMPDVDSLKRDPNDPDDNVVSHYWVDGSAGVVTALLRYWRYTGETRYKGVLDRLIPDCCRWYTAFPNLFQGLAGLGNTLLDVYEFTGDPRFLQEAHRTADGILLFRVERLSGLAFPGQQLLRISTDFGTGSAGIIAFLDRLRRALRGERTENFNFMLDSLVPEFIRAAEPVQTAGSA